MRSEHSRRRELVKERKREKTRGVRLKNKCLVWSGLVPMLCVHRSLMEYADENMHWNHIIKGSCFERCSDGVLQEMWLVFWALEKHCRNSVVGRSIWRQFKWAIGKSLKVKKQLGKYYTGWTPMETAGTQISFFLVSLTFSWNICLLIECYLCQSRNFDNHNEVIPRVK